MTQEGMIQRRKRNSPFPVTHLWKDSVSHNGTFIASRERERERDEREGEKGEKIYIFFLIETRFFLEGDWRERL